MMVSAPTVRTCERQVGVGGQHLDLDVGAVLRDHGDAGDGVADLDRGGAAAAPAAAISGQRRSKRDRRRMT